MRKIGLIGIGNIGKYFSKELRQAGYPLTVLDIDREKMKYAIELGAQPADNQGEVAQKSDLIILSLPGSPAVEDVMDGAYGILNHLREGQLVIDTGTTKPETDIRYEKLSAQKGAGFIDAPITWRSKGLIIMVGGTPENYEKGREVLTCLSYKLKHIGSIGQGQVLKLMNQMILAGRLAVWSEAIGVGKQHGVDPRLLKEYLEFPVSESLYGEDFSGGGHLALHYKDLGYLLEIAHDSGANLPITSLVHEIFKATKLYGDPDWVQPGIATYWRRLNKPK